MKEVTTISNFISKFAGTVFEDVEVVVIVVSTIVVARGVLVAGFVDATNCSASAPTVYLAGLGLPSCK